MAIAWKESYSVTNNEINEQHKKLLGIGERLYIIAFNAKQESQMIQMKKIVEELKEYTVYHFEFEEQLMVSYGYSQIQNHKKEHQTFIDQIQIFENEEVDLKQKDAILKMIIYLTDWISKHIMITDKQYDREFLKKGYYDHLES